MRAHRSLFTFFAFFLLTACGSAPPKSDPPPQPTKIVARGYLVGYGDGTQDLKVTAVAETRAAGGKTVQETIGEATYQNGTFELELRPKLEDVLLVPLKEAVTHSLLAARTDSAPACDGSVEIADKSVLANGARFLVETQVPEGESYVGDAVLVGGEPEQVFMWLYANKPTTMRGTQACTDGLDSTTVQFDLDLAQGWNVLAQATNSANASVRVTAESASDVKINRWLVMIPDEAQTSVGADAGSTPRNPKGTMGGYPAAELAGAVMVPQVTDRLGRSVPLGNGAAIGEDGSFNLVLTDVPADLLVPLDFGRTTSALLRQHLGGLDVQAAACSGSIQVVGQPLFQEAQLAVFLADKRKGSAQAGAANRTVEQWYVNTATTLAGSIRCETVRGTNTLTIPDLSLDQGWNFVLKTLNVSVAADDTVSYEEVWTRVPSMPPGVGWSYGTFPEIEVPKDEPQGGEDLGSTRSKLTGRLGQWPSVSGSISVTFDPFFSESDAGRPLEPVHIAADETLSSEDNRFNIDLPAFAEFRSVIVDGYLAYLDIKREWIEPKYSGSDSDAVEPEPTSPCNGDFEYASSLQGEFYAFYARPRLRLWQGKLADSDYIGTASVLVDGIDTPIPVELSWMVVDGFTDNEGSPLGTIEGQVACDDDLYIVDMDLVQGWNIVATVSSTLDDGTVVTLWTTVSSAPADTEWLARVNVP